jgi:RNA polymerase sigma factor (sigma-70 family)
VRPIRVLVVDDDPIVVASIAELIQAPDPGAQTSEPGITVVGTASNGAQAVEAVLAHRPDVVLMDIDMPVIDGIAATREITRLGTGAAVVMLTTHAIDDNVHRANGAGAVGFQVKAGDAAAVRRAVRDAHAGRLAFASEVQRPLADAALAASQKQRRARELLARLTPREQEVARLVAQSLSNREIADRMFLSPATVKDHVSEVIAKLDGTSRMDVAICVTRAE